MWVLNAIEVSMSLVAGELNRRDIVGTLDFCVVLSLRFAKNSGWS